MKEPKETTIPVSASVSPEFQKLIEKYGLSPTEVFRKGMALTLCELGDLRYTTPLNKERLAKSKNILEEIEEHENIIRKLLNKFKQYDVEK